MGINSFLFSNNSFSFYSRSLLFLFRSGFNNRLESISCTLLERFSYPEVRLRYGVPSVENYFTGRVSVFKPKSITSHSMLFTSLLGGHWDSRSFLVPCEKLYNEERGEIWNDSQQPVIETVPQEVTFIKTLM